MAELKEIFEMVTHRTEPDLDAWEQQERRQRTRARRRRAAALGFAAAIVALIGVFAAASLHGTDTTQPATTPIPPLRTTTNLMGVDVATGATDLVAGDVAPFAAAPSPDGTQLASVRVTDGHPQIYLSSVTGSGARQVTGLDGQRGCACGATNPTWLNDHELAFEGVLESGDHRIYELDLTDGRVRLLESDRGSGWDITPAFSAASGRLAYAENSWQAEPAGSGDIYATSVPYRPRSPYLMMVHRDGAFDPTWDPQGRRVAFTGAVKGGTAIFVSADPAGAGTRLTDGTDDSAPAWSPDGAQIAFVRDGTISVLTVSTGEVRAIAQGGDPSWSTDGSTIYFWTTS